MNPLAIPKAMTDTLFPNYTLADPREFWWCNSHNRPATHLWGTKHVCDPRLGGILLPCSCVSAKELRVILTFIETDDGLSLKANFEPQDLSAFRPETVAMATMIYKWITKAIDDLPNAESQEKAES